VNLELIRKLEREAHDKVWNADVNSEDFPNSFNVEFAELIVRECSKVLRDSAYKHYEHSHTDYYDGFNEALNYSAFRIEELFGVENEET
jgi:hypothetical protein